jgi:hypothetical protein
MDLSKSHTTRHSKRRKIVMKINESIRSAKPGAVNNKNPLGILIALAFFAGNPMTEGTELLPLVAPKSCKNTPGVKDEEK